MQRITPLGVGSAATDPDKRPVKLQGFVNPMKLHDFTNPFGIDPYEIYVNELIVIDYVINP